jgi:hypothetical protein
MKPSNALPKRLLLACIVVAAFAATVSVGAQTPADNKQQPGASEKTTTPGKEKAAEKTSALEEELSKTPAGKTVAKFFAAFNSGDIKTMRAFHESFGGDPENANKDSEFYERTGGLKPYRLTRSTKDTFEVLVQTKKDARWITFEFTLDTQEPYGINTINVSPAAPPAN